MSTTPFHIPKALLFTGYFLIALTNLQAQSFTKENPCVATEINNRLLQQDEQLQKQQTNLEKRIYEQTLAGQAEKSNEIYTIPVVVHIVHRAGIPIGTEENRTDADILNILAEVNKAYAHESGETFPNPYAGVDTRIRFCLAARDPSGNPTNGIVRHVDDELTYVVYNTQEDEVQLKYNWNPSKYYNIYLVKDIVGAGGFAYLAGAHGRSFDGAIIQSLGVGTWVHELGHAMNLRHTFHQLGQDTCPTNNDCLVDGDHVCDTPPHKETSCELDANSCSNDGDDTSTNNPFRAESAGGLGDMTDPAYNYMNYSCNGNFTVGQKARMRLAIEEIRGSYLASDVCTPLVDQDAAIIGVLLNDTCKVAQMGASAILANFGATALTSANLIFSIDGINKRTINWSGNLAYGKWDTIVIPRMTTTFGLHDFCVQVVAPNGETDPNTTNDRMCVQADVDEYCSSKGDYQYDVHLEAVLLGDINNTSGNNAGYKEFTNLSTALSLGHFVEATLTTSYNDPYTESCDWNIWIDLNQDYDFDDEHELIYTIRNTSDTIHTILFGIPEVATLGATRMRIMNSRYSYTAPEGDYFNGETEDYTVILEDNGPYTHTSFPYHEGFETELSLWKQLTTDSTDWYRNNRGSFSDITGTAAAQEGDYYMSYFYYYNTEDIATIESAYFDLSQLRNAKLAFYYHLYGENIGGLTLEVKEKNATTWTELWSISGDQGNEWLKAQIDLKQYDKKQVAFRFTGLTDGWRLSDMALDNISITGTYFYPCQSPIITSNQNNLEGIYAAAQTINSMGKVTAGKTVTFQAGQAITLNPGFHAHKGASFLGYIAPCQLSTIEQEAPEVPQRFTPPVVPIAESMQLQVLPNPLRHAAQIRFYLPESSEVVVGIYDLNGQLLTTVSAAERSRGWHTTQFTATQLPAGIYLVALRSKTGVLTKQVVVLE